MPVAFEWDDGNIGHIALHNVEPEEAEEALADPNRVPLKTYNTPTERRRGVIGSTENGRLLAVVYTMRGHAFRVLSARNASRRERELYRGR